MPNRSRSLLVAPSGRPVNEPQIEDASPFVWDQVHQTVLKFENPLLYQQSIASATSAEPLLEAMQRLVAMINTLRSSPRSSLEESSGHSPVGTPTVEALLPYVSEEAYDVLDALREEKRQEATLNGLPQLNTFCLAPALPYSLITISTLIPSLLWSLARSSYGIMHLIEGIRVKCWQPEQNWTDGMLRLVVMLEAETPTVRWCFDLATGHPAELLVEATAIVQSDELALPIRCAAAEASFRDSPCQSQHQLQAVLNQLQVAVPGLNTFLQGVAVELLQPGTDWQAGELRLRFGFAFSPQASKATDSEGVVQHPELIEAELMEEPAENAQQATSQDPTTTTYAIAELLAKTHVSVINPASRSLSPVTLVRVTAADTLAGYTQHTAQQQLEQTLLQLRSQQTCCADDEAQLTLIVRTAIARCNSYPNASDLDLLQPMLLMDELVPKLLWSITSSTYEIMQLVGGVPAQVLQPKATWQQGTLRLLAALHLKATDVDYRLDLSTGRSLKADVPLLGTGTIVQTTITIGSQPTPIEVVIAYLQQQLDEAMAEYRLLSDGVSIAWLEDVEQDWQSGTMELKVSLAFVPDAL